MKNKFYIMTALVISLTGCSNIEDGTQPTGNFPEDHIIRIVPFRKKQFLLCVQTMAWWKSGSARVEKK